MDNGIGDRFGRWRESSMDNAGCREFQDLAVGDNSCCWQVSCLGTTQWLSIMGIAGCHLVQL